MLSSISGTIFRSLYSVLILPLRYSGACRHKLEKQNKVGTDYATLVLQSLLTGKPFYADILDECSTLTEASSRDGCDLAAHFGFANSPLLALVYPHRIGGSPRTKAKEYLSTHRKVQRHHTPLASRMSLREMDAEVRREKDMKQRQPSLAL
jgi:hypothetical protein